MITIIAIIILILILVIISVNMRYATISTSVCFFLAKSLYVVFGCTLSTNKLILLIISNNNNNNNNNIKDSILFIRHDIIIIIINIFFIRHVRSVTSTGLLSTTRALDNVPRTQVAFPRWTAIDIGAAEGMTSTDFHTWWRRFDDCYHQPGHPTRLGK